VQHAHGFILVLDGQYYEVSWQKFAGVAQDQFSAFDRTVSDLAGARLVKHASRRRG